MAIAFDSASGRQTGTATSATLSHTCSGVDRILVVSVGVASGKTVTGVTYGGVAMTKVVDGTTISVGTYASMWILLNPATGANNIVASFSASTNYGISSVSYTGCRQSSQPDTVATTVKENATGTRLATVNVVSSGCWLVGGCLITETAGVDSVSGGVERIVTGYQHDVIDSNGIVGTGNQGIGYVWSTTDNHIFFGFSIAPQEGSPRIINFI